MIVNLFTIGSRNWYSNFMCDALLPFPHFFFFFFFCVNLWFHTHLCMPRRMQSTWKILRGHCVNVRQKSERFLANENNNIFMFLLLLFFHSTNDWTNTENFKSNSDSLLRKSNYNSVLNNVQHFVGCTPVTSAAVSLLWLSFGSTNMYILYIHKFFTVTHEPRRLPSKSSRHRFF